VTARKGWGITPDQRISIANIVLSLIFVAWATGLCVIAASAVLAPR